MFIYTVELQYNELRSTKSSMQGIFGHFLPLETANLVPTKKDALNITIFFSGRANHVLYETNFRKRNRFPTGSTKIIVVQQRPHVRRFRSSLTIVRK